MQATLQFYLECVVTTLQCSLPAMGAGATQDLDCNVKEAQGIPKSSHLKKHSCQLLHNSRRPGVGQDGFKGEKNHTANQSFWSPCQSTLWSANSPTPLMRLMETIQQDTALSPYALQRLRTQSHNQHYHNQQAQQFTSKSPAAIEGKPNPIAGIQNTISRQQKLTSKSPAAMESRPPPTAAAA
eukprot:1147896-Pelagomonas_calceolata.AAC.1